MSKFLIVLLAVGVMFYVNRVLNTMLIDFAEKNQRSALRVGYVRKTLNFGSLILGFVLVCFFLGLGYHQVFIFISSFLAVLGIALIAQWSMLSHLTAGVIIFFAFPYGIGDRIRVVDKDDDISGRILEIALFHVLIRRDDGTTVVYPNSMMLQKAVIKLNANSSLAARAEGSGLPADLGAAPAQQKEIDDQV
ncbi:mechanosensitive ion channel family protein [Zhongshania borealis]|jgi:small-conductance mechanosensitive channel|uniref:Small-conductance mechanosensitive channel n=1 Tax=Zhongshania borealis TaxID=889488 RepID=A0ABP7W9E9_9GAMM|tara:strand:+ start:355 stop:930 length:576 start_codon:yes stop_codon:yes gene_type:complete